MILQSKKSNVNDLVQVCMIDFAHTLYSTECSDTKMQCRDEGYLIGLINLIQYFNDIIIDIDSYHYEYKVPDEVYDIVKRSLA